VDNLMTKKSHDV